MLLVVSPAKSLDYETPLPAVETTRPDRLLLEQAEKLVAILKTFNPADIAHLMSISDSLAALNFARFQEWQCPFPKARARAAVFAFAGDVYAGLDAHSLDAVSLEYLQQHLRILSGLYGVLRPFDEILPYRLEMGTRLPNSEGKDLYAFWGDRLAQHLQQDLERLTAKESPPLVNLASDEYFKAIRPKALAARVITPVFLDRKGASYKIISFYAKRARGLMVRFAALNAIEKPEDLKHFDLDGYAFAAPESSTDRWVFKRDIVGG